MDGLASNGTRFVAVSSFAAVTEDLGVYVMAGGQVIHNAPEAELTDWDRVNLPVSNNFTAFASGNGISVGVGRSGLIMSSPLASSGYSVWANEPFGQEGLSSPESDPDLDGIPNLVE